MTSSLRSLKLIYFFFCAFAFFPSAVRALKCVKCSWVYDNSCGKNYQSEIADCEAGEKCFTAIYKGQSAKYERGCQKTDMKGGCQDRTTGKGEVRVCYCNTNICNSFGDRNGEDGSGSGLKCYHCISDCKKPELKKCFDPFVAFSKYLCMKTTQNGRDVARGCIPDVGQAVQCVKGQGGGQRIQTCLCNTHGCNNDSFGGGSRLGGFSLLWALAALTPLFLIHIGNIGMDSFSA